MHFFYVRIYSLAWQFITHVLFKPLSLFTLFLFSASKTLLRHFTTFESLGVNFFELYVMVLKYSRQNFNHVAILNIYLPFTYSYLTRLEWRLHSGSFFKATNMFTFWSYGIYICLQSIKGRLVVTLNVEHNFRLSIKRVLLTYFLLHLSICVAPFSMLWALC